MPESHFKRRVNLPLSREAAFNWHERPGAFERLTPPWENVRVESRVGTIHDGDRLTIALRIGGVPLHWIAEHYGYQASEQFADRQVFGPFAAWNHVHRFLQAADNRSILEDDITYQLPGGWLGTTFGKQHAARTLERMFRYRHRITQDDMNAHAKFSDRSTLSVAVTGATGLVGGELLPLLSTGGHRIVAMGREGGKKSPALGESGSWNTQTGAMTFPDAKMPDAIVHLAGENIAGGRWTKHRKELIRNSRVDPTHKLCEWLAKQSHKPRVLICASAIGYYGTRGDTILTESSPAGDGFLAEVCQSWEAATKPAVEAGIRVVNLRFGVILSPKGGALASMLTPFKLGGGGIVGPSTQYWSWVAIDDVIGAIHHALLTDQLNGPTNCTSPTPVTNAEFTKTLGRVLHRPTIVPMPAFAARLLLGEMADELLLASARVSPTKLEDSGYQFRFAELEPALRHLLGKVVE